MIKKIAHYTGAALSFVSMGSMATAGSLAEAEAEPMVEDLVIAEEDPTSGAWLPIVGLLIIAAVAASSGNDDGSSKDRGSEDPIDPPK